ncbi:hypothetical protein AtEden1_Chr3g0190551 [Arabidopsis thaliana]
MLCIADFGRCIMSKHNLVIQSMITLPPTRYGKEDCKICGSINNHSKFSYLKIVKEILFESLFRLRKASGNQKGVNGLGFSGQLVYFLVVRQLVSSKKDELWFCINNMSMRFSLIEFYLVTGLPCWIKEDEIPVDFECDWPLSPGETPIKVDDLIAQLKVLDDEKIKLQLVMLIVFMLSYGITKYLVPKEYLANAKKNIHAYPWEKMHLMLVSSIGREVIHLFSTKKMRKLRFCDGSDVDAEMQTQDSAGETQTDAYVERQTDDSEYETQTLEKDQGLVERFQKLRFQDDEPSAITAIVTTPLKKSRYKRVLRKKQIFSPFGHKKKSERR